MFVNIQVPSLRRPQRVESGHSGVHVAEDGKPIPASYLVARLLRRRSGPLRLVTGGPSGVGVVVVGSPTAPGFTGGGSHAPRLGVAVPASGRQPQCEAHEPPGRDRDPHGPGAIVFETAGMGPL